ncbi:HemK2/MTQ2 family protein methyltransferase [Promethearchaeum syntrophicum]|uniref:HemK2/MTQ2 family protein methyltransferase n=1 Tax=Promethearchaeum syntrophicum TaxID=2594042 RepID=A0A5B9D7T1_9ARCH|nr:HemK2/MTQ2 family protein methyltransferase [Candidatus Prometheoarchaeum syntrophicum]QEE15065.1 N5-glutamine S-adenosyl-L-methionine-dependent methyltransferase [Candidatus Prometheoarchaeum syntrophicum]
MGHDFSKYKIIEYYEINMVIPEQVYSPHDDTKLISEFILDWIKKIQIPKRNLNIKPIRVLEIGYGPGTISLLLISRFLKKKVNFFHVGTEINPLAVETAKYNAKLNKLENYAQFLEGNLFKPLNTDELVQPYDLILFNPPYLQSDLDVINETNRQLIDLAWDGGPTGNEVLLEFLNHLSKFLKKNGELFFITSSLVNQETIQQALKIQEVKILEQKSHHIFFEDIILYHCKK